MFGDCRINWHNSSQLKGRYDDMIEEQARVVEIQDQYIVVETIRTTACESCKAKVGCGQSALAKWSENQTAKNYLSVNRLDHKNIRLNDIIQIGIPEDALVKAAFLMYLLPLLVPLFLVLFAANFGFSDNLIAVLSLLGFASSFFYVSQKTKKWQKQAAFEPIILKKIDNLDQVEVIESHMIS